MPAVLFFELKGQKECPHLLLILSSILLILGDFGLTVGSFGDNFRGLGATCIASALTGDPEWVPEQIRGDLQAKKYLNVRYFVSEK